MRTRQTTMTKRARSFKRAAERMADVILETMPTKRAKSKRTRRPGPVVDRMTENLIGALNRAEAAAAAVSGRPLQAGPTGACCIDGTCHDNFTETSCVTNDGGEYMGNGTTCATISCNPIKPGRPK